jgi:seryl-tRNA synthetase
MNFYAKNLMEKEVKHLEKLNEEISELEIEQASIEARLTTLEAERKLFASKVKDMDDWELMDETNNHNPMLVKCINSAWNDEETSKHFEDIVVALMMRDSDEVEEKLGELQSVTDNWIDFLPNYLMHIADDWDLTTILHFVRWDIIFNKPTLGTLGEKEEKVWSEGGR